MATTELFERPRSGERTILVHIHFQSLSDRDSLPELRVLASSAGAEVMGIVLGQRDAPDAKHFVGQGKLDEIKQLLQMEQADLVLFNHTLTPGQERNLEAALCCRVLDRTGLILDIFAQRARTFEGKLQVELAQLQHLSTRLVRGWSHLERQKGGIGLRGPGEKQLESDRRLVRARIKSIRQRLGKIRNQRHQSGAHRRQAEVPVVAVVGYTNAGKSTLFNVLTAANVYVQDQLFATLDPTLRQVTFAGLGQVIMADTVGFIQNLPHDLIDAFQATLEETKQADLLLHVIDAADEQRQHKMDEVQRVLAQIGAQDVPQIEVYNKVDLLTDVTPHVDDTLAHDVRKVWLSATTNQGIEGISVAMQQHWAEDVIATRLSVPSKLGAWRAALYRSGAILQEDVQPDTGHWLLHISLLRDELEHLCRTQSLQWQDFVV